jgi:hypothetical protein
MTVLRLAARAGMHWIRLKSRISLRHFARKSGLIGGI